MYHVTHFFHDSFYRTFRDHCMVFIRTKKECHRLHILLGLMGVRVGELHGNMSQVLQ